MKFCMFDRLRKVDDRKVGEENLRVKKAKRWWMNNVKKISRASLSAL